MKNIGSKIYKNSDQIQFSNISKDFNEIHVDKVFARKLIFGDRIVHGINILLTALSKLKENNLKIRNINCSFLNPVFLNKKVNFFKKQQNKHIIIYIKVDNDIKCIFTISEEIKTNDIKKKDKKKSIKVILRKKFKANNNFSDVKNFYLNKDKINIPKKFSKVLRIINKAQIQEIISISFFVGMICPGKYSLISVIDINLCHNGKIYKDIFYKVKKKDNRINRFEIQFSNNIFGKVFAYSYKIPLQKKMSFFKNKVKKNIFLNKKNSLIIGGSRGLGEDTSKILAASGSNVTLTYLIGKLDAKKIKKEIEFHTNINCKILKLDILKNSFLRKIKKLKKIDFIFYFGTIKITSNKKFNLELYKKYKKIYCLNFFKMCKMLNKYSTKKIKIFFPSSIFLNEDQKNFNEYVRAKRDSEKIIKKINKNLKKIKVTSVRLPVMNTSQNISIFNQKKIGNENLLAPIIKNFVKN
tara:strand:+ start:881 stop:2284 length:1404 start_codon:yes stop_codon:yes gene_type:complete